MLKKKPSACHLVLRRPAAVVSWFWPCVFFAQYVWVKMESAKDWEAWEHLTIAFVSRLG